jgi:hypothetical protein
MAKYTNQADGTSSVNAEQIENNTGIQYRASGNLFIARQTSKTIPRGYDGNRGSIVGFSSGSAIRMRRYLRECRSEYGYMVTLTYPYEFPTDGAESKNHLRRFLQEVQREYKRGHINPKHDDGMFRGWGEPPTGSNYKGIRPLHSAFWFLEFQRRGAPHYHIFLNWAPSKEWVSSRWYEIVNSEDIRHLHAGTRTEKLNSGRAGTISYASKYAAKLEQKTPPPGYENIGRFWGVYGDRITVSAAAFVSRSVGGVPHVLAANERMISSINKAIVAGKAEVIKAEDGIRVVAFNDDHVMMEVRRKLGALSWAIHGDKQLFQDADVDYGEIYNDDVSFFGMRAKK